MIVVQFSEQFLEQFSQRDLILNDLKLENDSTPQNLKYGLEILQKVQLGIKLVIEPLASITSVRLECATKLQLEARQTFYRNKLEKNMVYIIMGTLNSIRMFGKFIQYNHRDVDMYKDRVANYQLQCWKELLIIYWKALKADGIQQMSKISLEYGVGDLCHQIKYCDNQYFIEMLKFKYIIFSNIMLDWSTFSQSFSNEEKKNNKIRIKRAQFINIYSSEAYVFTSKESILYY
ncbi:unnamed protein product [Paramecium octaurelia]|uniref:Uncharacterized protein n=1 Tax=Paramecium octaurelia TaxID=43137 RepID=A0A8S1XJ55_PAROT|nr:unnamed protein product [Paramecium octaurelia]